MSLNPKIALKAAIALLDHRKEQLASVTKERDQLVAGILEDDCWADDWCPVCHEHPSHDHGGKDCPMKVLAQADKDT